MKDINVIQENIKKCEYFKEKWKEDKQTVNQIDKVIEALYWVLDEGYFPW